MSTGLLIYLNTIPFNKRAMHGITQFFIDMAGGRVVLVDVQHHLPARRGMFQPCAMQHDKNKRVSNRLDARFRGTRYADGNYSLRNKSVSSGASP